MILGMETLSPGHEAVRENGVSGVASSAARGRRDTMKKNKRITIGIADSFFIIC